MSAAIVHRPIDYTDVITALVCRHGYTFEQVGAMTPAQVRVISDWHEEASHG